jgi:ParB/RepB/Spo0J family partition protein
MTSEMTEQLSLIPKELRTPKQKKVLLDELSLNIPGDEPAQSFIESIRDFGLLQPIALVEGESGYKIAFGRRRIKAARALNWLSISAWIFPEGMTSAAILALIENRHRSENLTAKLQAIDELRLKVPEDKICEEIGLTKQEMKQAIALLDNLVPEMQTALQEGRINASTAKKAVRLPKETQQVLVQQEKISSKDIDEFFRVQAVEQIQELPDSLFEELTEQTWQEQARPLIEQLLVIIPETEEAREYLKLITDSLKAKV